MPIIVPAILAIINFSLSTGCFPSFFKHAAIQSILKILKLDTALPKNYRPISQLPFMSKIVEKVVATQLTPALERHNIYDKSQSGKQHSKENALLRVSNDILMPTDAGDFCV